MKRKFIKVQPTLASKMAVSDWLPSWKRAESSQESRNQRQEQEREPLLSEEQEQETRVEAATSSPLLSRSQSSTSSFTPASPRITRRLGAPSNQDQNAQRHLNSPYSGFKVKIVFLLGLLLLLASVSLFLLLCLSIFTPIPNLIPFQTAPPIFPIWLLLTSILLLAPGLYLFELNSSTTRAIHYASISLLFVSMILLVSITTLRKTELLMGLPCLLMAILSFGWCIGTSHLIDGIRIEYKILLEDENNEAGRDLENGTRTNNLNPNFILTSIPVSKAQNKWKRYLKIFLAWLGTIAVSLTLLALTFDLILTGIDSGLKTRSGEKVWIRSKDLSKSIVEQQENGHPLKASSSIPDLQKMVKKVPDFRLYISCEGESKRLKSNQITSNPIDRIHQQHPLQVLKSKPDKGNHTLPLKPTALVFTERGVAGEIGSEWVREMVRDDDNNDDGHLSLDRVCFFDRIGYGYSDYLSSSISLPFQTAALHRALTSIGEIKSTPTSLLEDSTPNDNSTISGQFLLVSTGYGSLFARHFAATYPDLIHSQLLVDSELPSTWYTDVVSSKSNLRAGYKSRGHGSFSIRMFYNDVLPVLLEPLSITRFLGLLATFGPTDRLLSPREHGGAKNSLRNPGGGGFRLKNGGSNLNLLSTSLNERLDANLGSKSPNYKIMNSEEVKKVLNDPERLSSKPLAVLTSFWKLHLDLEGWGNQHVKELVEKGREGKGLIGWWRVGSRENKGKGGGDDGHAMGICGNEVGRVWCKEAVRKVLGWDLARSLETAEGVGEGVEDVFDV